MITKEQVRDWMRNEVNEHGDYREAVTCKINCTLLAEGAADHFNHWEWLDDETHFVWDAAFEVADGF